MYSLINIKFNWNAFLITAILIYFILPGISWYSYFAILITIHQFVLLFNSIEFVIPVRYLFGAFMCLQFFVGPTLAYNGLDQYQFDTYKMRITEVEYFSYAIPAVLSFIIGLHIRAGKLEGEVVDVEKIKAFSENHKNLPYIFIAIGFVSSIISEFFSTELAFVFYLLGGFKFVGLFIIIISSYKLKPLPLIIVIGSIISSSLGMGMFHDLLTWLIFTGIVLAIKYKPKFAVKLAITISFFIVAIVIQQIKGSYRETVWEGSEEGGVDAFSNAYEKRSDEIFEFAALAPSIVRINQGFIITNIMSTVPAKIPHSNGYELYQILEAAFLPRIIATNKLTAGNREIFMKYSGMRIAKKTSMGLSSLGDAYINFGVFGGCIFMFFLGMLFSEVLKGFHKYGKKFPVLLLFTPLVFYYPIRPDCELQTIMGHLVKSCFLIFILVSLWKKYFILHTESLWKKYSY